MSLRNITFSLPSDLIQQAEVYAAQHDTSMNALVRELLQEALGRDDRARVAAERLLAIAAQGPYFTTDPASIRREDL